MALGLEQNNAAILIVGHSDKAINERINSLRYARVRRGKQNPVKAFFTYNSVPDISLSPWYQIPPGYDVRQIYPSGLIEKINVTFPPWFRLVSALAWASSNRSFGVLSVVQTLQTALETGGLFREHLDKRSTGRSQRQPVRFDGLRRGRRHLVDISKQHIAEQSSPADSHAPLTQLVPEAAAQATLALARTVTKPQSDPLPQLLFLFFFGESNSRL